MDTRRVALVCLGSAAWLALFVGNVFGVSLPFHDDFENIAVGYYPDANGWQTGFSGVGAQVSDAVAQSGARSFQLRSSPSWSRCDYVYLDAVPDRLSYQASVYMDPVGGRATWVGLLSAVGGQLPCYNHFIITNEDGVAGAVYFQGMLGLPAVLVGEFEIGDWVTVRADLSLAAQQADLWLDGVAAASDVPIQPKEFVDPMWGPVVLDRFGMAEHNWAGGGIGIFYVDDVALSEWGEPPAIEAVVDLTPSQLNTQSGGRWILCRVELAEGYSVADIDVGSLRLAEVVPPEPRAARIGDYDADGVPDLTVRFSRSALTAALGPGEHTVVLAGSLGDGTALAGSDVVRVKSPRGKTK